MTDGARAVRKMRADVAALHDVYLSLVAAENPAVSTVLEHLQVYAVLEDTLSPAEKRDHARRIVDAVLALQVKP